MVGLGAWYTPPALVSVLVDAAHQGWRRAGCRGVPRVLDPACGEGAFLVAVAERLCRTATPDQVASGLYGIDVDAAALARARQRLGDVLGEQAGDVHLVCTDALLAPPDWSPFDWVLGNPPWVSAATLSRRQGAWRERVRASFETARGNWDLCCPFVERALDWTRPGGWHGFVLPNAFASAPYGSAARALVAAQQVQQLWDWSETTPFGASAYPVGYLVRKSPGPGSLALPTGGKPWPLGIVPELAPGLPTLDEQAEVRGAATVSEAYALLDLLVDCSQPEPGDLRVVNSGTLDPERTLWGERDLRYLKTRWRHPIVPTDRLSALSDRRLAQARAPKVIVASLTRRIEAFVDRKGGWLPAKSTTVVLPGPGIDLGFLGAVLNSELATAWLKSHHGGQALRGGHLRIGPPQLRGLPLPRVSPGEASRLGGMSPGAGREAAIRRAYGL